MRQSMLVWLFTCVQAPPSVLKTYRLFILQYVIWTMPQTYLCTTTGIKAPNLGTTCSNTCPPDKCEIIRNLFVKPQQS